MKMPVADVTKEDVTAVLDSIWRSKAETARRVRSRIERVLDVARVRGYRAGENPARFRGHIKLIVAKQKTERGHHEALDWRELPGFIQRLRHRQATAARALEFAILTGARTAEVREAVWSEIDGKLWSVPAERMKINRPHRVPLSPRTIEILAEMKPSLTSHRGSRSVSFISVLSRGAARTAGGRSRGRRGLSRGA